MPIYLDEALVRLVESLERIEMGVSSMAQSLQVIALRFGGIANVKPVWTMPEFLEFVEGTPKTYLLSQFVKDPDPGYPGAKPLEIDAQNVSPALAAMGVQVVDLGRDVEVRYDGRAVGATLTTPVVMPAALVGVADDGVPDGGLSVS